MTRRLVLPAGALPPLLPLLLLLLLLLQLVCVSPSSATDSSFTSFPNLILNPGFEASRTELSEWSGASHADASGNAHTGLVCARLGQDGGATSLSQYLAPHAAPPGRCYAVQFWVKEAPSYDPARNQLEASLTIDGQRLPLTHNTGSTTPLPMHNGALESQSESAPNKWQLFYFYQCPPSPPSSPPSANVTHAGMRLKVRGNGFLVDDVSVSLQSCPDAAEFEAYLRTLLLQYNLPSLAVASVKEGVTICAAAVGTKVIHENLPVSLTDKYHIGSDGKGMTALIVGMAVEEGRLTWDTRVADVFPEVPMTDEFKLINVTQLLSHSSGIGQEGDIAVFNDLVPTLDCGDTERNLQPMRHEVLRFLAQRNLTTPPGKQWAYSNAGYMVAGQSECTRTQHPRKEEKRQSIPWEQTGTSSA